MKYPILCVIFVCISCNQNRLKLIDAKGNIVLADRRMPVYNREMFEKQAEFKKLRAKPINNYKLDEDGSGGKYFSTGHIETLVTPRGFQKIETVAPVYKKGNTDVVSDNNLQHKNGFIPLYEININENKNIESTKKILLNRQNIVTDSEYRPKKTYSAPVPKKSPRTSIESTVEKRIDKFQNEKPYPPIETVVENKIYFIKVLESQALAEVSDKIKEIKALSSNAISIEQNKQNRNYQLIIGPINNKKETNKILVQLHNLEYNNATIID